MSEVPETIEETQPVWPETIDVKILLPQNNSLLLPSINVSENLNSIRQVLAEFQETAFITSFVWKFIQTENAEGVVLLDATAGIELNDFSELNGFVAPTATKILFEIVEEPYDLKKIKNHLTRLNTIIQKQFLSTSATTQSLNEEKTPETTTTTVTSEANNKNGLVNLENLFEPVKISKYFDETFRVANVDNLSTPPLATAIKSIYASGWNNPPSYRRLQGDLMYVEVVLAHEGTFIITATARGFYVNKSNRSFFDPSPASNAHFSHNLFSTLLSISLTLRNAWKTLCENSMLLLEKQSGPLDGIAAAYNGFSGDLFSIQPKAWILPTTQKNEESKFAALPTAYDMFRIQETLKDLHGVEELGAPREWNDEIQSIRSLVPDGFEGKILKARLEHRVITEFTENCKRAVVAISEGLIAPLTYSDPSQSDIYVYNGIFLSRAEDTKDTFNISQSSESARKITALDFANQKIIRSLDLPGLGTVLCTLVDYKGTRYVGQSIIPGIFNQGENSARLLYGVLEKGKNVTVKNNSLQLMEELSSKLLLAKRQIPVIPFAADETTEVPPTEAENTPVDPLNKLLSGAENAQTSPIKVDNVDNVPVDTTTNSLPHFGPIESKIIQGSDGKTYVLEVMRLTPRDANYIAGEKGTQKIADEVLAKMDATLAPAYAHRQELIEIFIQRKVNVARQTLLLEAMDKEKQGKQDKKEATETTPAASTPAPTTPAEGDAETDDIDVQIVKEELKKESLTMEETLQEELAAEYSEKFRAITPQSLNIEINPNVFMNFSADVRPDILAKDEEFARELSSFLFDYVLPAVTKQIREEEFYPKDFDAMVTFLHRKGINMRYLGQLAKLAQEQEKEDTDLMMEGKQRVHSMHYYWLEFLIVEMIARSVKHMLNKCLRDDKLVNAAPAVSIASLLNHVISMLKDDTNKIFDKKDSEEIVATSTPAVVSTEETTSSEEKQSKTSSKKAKKQGKAAVKSTGNNNNTSTTSTNNEMVALYGVDGFADRLETLQTLRDTLLQRYLYECPLLQPTAVVDENNQEINTQFMFVALLRGRISPSVLIHRICQQCGLVLAQRDYNFKASTPFVSSDILALLPKIKHCEPDYYLPEVVDMLTTSANYLESGSAVTAFEMAQNALNLITQVTGTNHIQAFRAADQLNAVTIASSDLKSAIQMSSRTLALSSLVNGPDSQDSIMHHIQLGVLYAEDENLTKSIAHLRTAIYLLVLTVGERHPEIANVYLRLAVIYEKYYEFENAAQALLRARILTTGLLKSCLITISLANLYFRNQRIHEAVATQKHAFKILKELVNPDDTRLIEVKKNLEMYLRASVGIPYPSQSIENLSLGNQVDSLMNTSDENNSDENKTKSSKKRHSKKSKAKK